MARGRTAKWAPRKPDETQYRALPLGPGATSAFTLRICRVDFGDVRVAGRLVEIPLCQAAAGAIQRYGLQAGAVIIAAASVG
ncbi:MAG: hypothetical protein QOC86_2797 [Gaiellales bacterium]|nr:hypothetical protein [Gaiellales bacterium]